MTERGVEPLKSGAESLPEPGFSVESDDARVEVLVIGAGPAGSLAAHGCAQQGLSVWLVDRASFPREKVCGCCLNKRAIGVLETQGLGEALEAASHNLLTGVQLAARGRRAQVGLPAGLAISRARLDHNLVTLAERAGASLFERTSAAVQGDGAVVLRGPDGLSRVRPGCTIVADGLGGRSLDDHPAFGVMTRTGSHIGVGASVADAGGDVPAGRIAMACGDAGYVGMVRLEDGRLDIAAALSPGYLQACGSVRDAVAGLMQQAGVTVPTGLERARFRGTPRLTQRRWPLHAPGVLVVGDAAGYVEPFTGEGMAWAMAGGVAVAEYASRWNRLRLRADLSADGSRNQDPTTWNQTVGPAWQRAHRRLVARRQWGCRLIAEALRRPRLMGAIVGALAVTPSAASPVVEHLNRAGAS